ncbi:hypothetical protein ACOMHN_067719 [Nucella lapillus]
MHLTCSPSTPLPPPGVCCGTQASRMTGPLQPKPGGQPWHCAAAAHPQHRDGREQRTSLSSISFIACQQ